MLATTHAAGERVLACAGPGVVEALPRSDSRRSTTCRLRRWSWAGTARSTSSGCVAPRTACAPGAFASSRRISIRPTPAPRACCRARGRSVAAVQTAGGRLPEVAGKPEAAMAALVRTRYRDPVVMIGDRPSTDGSFATALGVPFALVLSGIAGSDRRGTGARSRTCLRGRRPRRPRPAPRPRVRAGALTGWWARGSAGGRASRIEGERASGKAARRASTNATSMPNTKPPMWASVAIPLEDCVKICSTSHSPSTTTGRKSQRQQDEDERDQSEHRRAREPNDVGAHHHCDRTRHAEEG